MRNYLGSIIAVILMVITGTGLSALYVYFSLQLMSADTFKFWFPIITLPACVVILAIACTVMFFSAKYILPMRPEVRAQAS